jgi:ABC-2 type transport system ATP-binding protein
MTPVLTIDKVTKYYSSVRALNEVSFEVPQGSVFGILGPNGSGKTTLLGIILDVLKVNKGNYLWFGEPGTPEQRKRIGSMLETPNFYSYLSATDNLRVTQAISGRGDAAAIDEVLKKVNLYERRWSAFKTFSLGMKQRLAIGAALLGNPRVLVLDEPTNGLDPVGIAEIRSLIIELKDKGHTVIMASHLLDEVEKVCTHAAILKTGNVIAKGPVEDIMMDEDIVEIGSLNYEGLGATLTQLNMPFTRDEKAKTYQIIYKKGEARLDQMNQLFFEKGIVLNHMLLKKKRLEARFFELTNN